MKSLHSPFQGMSHNDSEQLGSTSWLQMLVEFSQLFLQIILMCVLVYHYVSQGIEKVTVDSIGLGLALAMLIG